MRILFSMGGLVLTEELANSIMQEVADSLQPGIYNLYHVEKDWAKDTGVSLENI